MATVDLNGQTQLVGLIGWPVEHSLSPAMHNAAFDALQLNWRYVPLPVAPEAVRRAVDGLAALGFRGANVTVPHKRAVMNRLDEIAPDARSFGAVNTLVVERESDVRPALRGDNTDYAGFVQALRQDGFEPTGKRALVVGAGGAARAVVFGLLKAEIAAVTVLNRTPARAERLVADLAPFGERTPLDPLGLTDERLIESARRSDLLVNTTPVGMWPHVERSIWPAEVAMPPSMTVFDLVYNPLETRLLRQARAAGARAIDGLGMLVTQGALSFEMWTGREAPIEVMRETCEQKLRGDA